MHLRIFLPACLALVASLPGGVPQAWAAPPVRAVVAGVAIRGDVAPADGERVDLVLREVLAERGQLAPLNGDGTKKPPDLWAGLDEAEAAAKRARDAFDNLENDACVAAMNEARTLYDRGPAYVLASKGVADGLLVLAQCLESKGDTKGAKAAYTERVVRWPEMEVDPNAFPPAVVDGINVVKAQLSVSTVDVEVVSEPTGSRVTVDGVARGNSPQVMALYPGKHFILVQDLSGAARTAVVTVVSNGKGIRAKVTLEPELWIAPLGGVVDAVAAGKAADAKGSIKDLASHAVMETVVAGLVLPAGSGKRPRVALLGFSAVDGSLVRGAAFTLPAGPDTRPELTAALDALLGSEPEAGLPEATAMLEGRAYKAPAGKGGGKGGSSGGGRGDEVASEPADGKGGSGGRKWVILGILGGGVSVLTLAVLVAALVAGGTAGLFGLYLLFPPSQNSTRVTVNGEKLTR